MLRRSLRTPQLTQTTGMCCARKASIRAASGAMGFRLGEMSMPRESSQPPLVQKSFCMSTIRRADFAASTVMFCGSAAIASGRTGGAGRVMSTASGVTFQAWAGLVPITTGVAGLAVTFMSNLLTRLPGLLRGARDALDEIVHGLDLLHRELLSGRHDDRAILPGDRAFPN